MRGFHAAHHSGIKFMNKIKTITCAAAVLAASNLSATFLAGWNFNTTTGLGTDLVSGFGAELKTGLNDATLNFGEFNASNGLGVGTSYVAASPDSFWDDNGFSFGSVAANNETGTKSIVAVGDGLSFSIVLDASNVSGLKLYLMYADQSGLGYGDLGSGEFINPLVVTLDNGTSTTQLGANTFNHSNSDFQDQTGFLDSDGSLDISFLDGADVATITFTTNTYTGSGSNIQNLIVDNIGLVGTGGISVVPEPSTYAAIAGALAMAFVAYRRRR